MKRRIFITGASGFVASHLARKCVELGDEVHLSIRSTSNLWRIKDILSKLKLHEVDISQQEPLKKIIKKVKPEVIFHLANAALYGGVHPTVKPYIDVNLLGTINMIDACADIEYECFVNTGSSAEYGPKEKKMKEQDLCNPQSVYAITKLAGTNYASYIGKTQKKPIITFRLFSPYGAYDDPKRLMSEAIVNSLEGKPIIFSNPRIVRDYIYIDDVINAYLKIIKKAKNLQGEIFNLGSGRETTIKEVVSAILKITGSKSSIKWGILPPRDFESMIWQADISKMKKLIGWKPQNSFLDGLKETIKWYRQNLKFYRDKVRRFQAG